MAQLSVTVSTSSGSEFEVSYGHDILALDISTDLSEGNPYERFIVHIHGTKADLQLLADRIVAAVYPEDCRPELDAQVDAEREDGPDFEHQRAGGIYPPADAESKEAEIVRNAR